MNNSEAEIVARDPSAITPPRASDPVDLVGRAVPEMMTTVLERRYLSAFQASLWDIQTAADDGGRPLLREVIAMGRPRPGEDLRQAMPHVLTATHTPGQALVMMLHGNGSRHRIYFGGRRIAAEARGSTEDYLNGQAGLLQAHVPGLELSPVARLGSESLSELAEFLQSAPALAVVTGVPAVRGPASGVFQNIDRLIDATGEQRYALTVIAEPLDPTTLDLTIDHCRRLKSEMHALVRTTITRSTTQGSSRTVTDDEATGWRRELPNYLAYLALFCQTVGLFAGAGPLAGIATPALLGMNLIRQNGQQTSDRTTTTESSGSSGAVELLDATAEACEALLQRHIDRLESARSNGWWRTSVFVAAESDGALESVTAALRGMSSGSGSSLDPMRVVRPASYVIRGAMTRGQPVLLRPGDPSVRHPLGTTFDALATCVSSDELAILVNLPQRDVPGLPMRPVAEFGLAVPPAGPDSIRAGALLTSHGREAGAVSLTADELNRHLFIAGMTGYGKTTTAKSLLLQSYATLDVPFLVIEPAKAEYRELAGHPLLRGRLSVFDLGGGPGALPLRLNPFRPVAGVPLLRHIDLLKAVFNAAFPMFAGMSYVLEDAMLELYTERGWNLHTSQNDLLGPRPNEEDLISIIPALGDLHDKIEQVLQRRQYGREVHQNLGAALRSRIGSLMVGSKGAALNTHRSVSAADLFTRPCVIELRNLGDDEEKAFVMALLLGMLYEFAESRQTGVQGLQHLTLIEEAHRLLAAPGRGGSEVPDAQAKAVSMFTDMLAEMRSYGEGFIVADQVPTKLAPEALKNTNVKILHRLVAPDDRAVTGAAINLTENQSRQLATLGPGIAVVHDDRIDSAVLVKMAQPSDFAVDAGPPAQIPLPDRRYLLRNTACRGCSAPCEFSAAADRRASATSPAPAVGVMLAELVRGDAGAAWRAFAQWRAGWRTDMAGRSPQLGGTERGDGEMYCALSQACYRWLGDTLAARAAAVGASTPPVERKLQHDRLAAQLGRWCASWLTAESLDVKERRVFDAVHERLAAALSQAPPRELPGCARCPRRCLALTAVAPLLGEELRVGVAGRASARTPPESRIRAITSLLDPTVTADLARLDEPDRRAFLYCLVTAALGDSSAADDVLGALRAPGSNPGAESGPAGASLVARDPNTLPNGP